MADADSDETNGGDCLLQDAASDAYHEGSPSDSACADAVVGPSEESVPPWKTSASDLAQASNW